MSWDWLQAAYAPPSAVPFGIPDPGHPAGAGPDLGRGPTNLRAGILATAQALGMSPEALATIISYETGGTFDPTQPGPTTQWGQHRGFIQFGEPQAREYGADFSSPEAALASQLGPDGAVVRYFRDHGWQPGMSVLDAYSIVNAGGPGRYNASDAGNGGAPGTVADKVRDQFGPHWENASEVLGFGAGPADTGSFGADPSIAGAFGASTLPMEDWNHGTGGNALADMTTFGNAGATSAPGQIAAPEQGNALAALGQGQQPGQGGAGGYAGGMGGAGVPQIDPGQTFALRPRVDGTVQQIIAAFSPRALY